MTIIEAKPATTDDESTHRMSKRDPVCWGRCSAFGERGAASASQFDRGPLICGFCGVFALALTTQHGPIEEQQ